MKKIHILSIGGTIASVSPDPLSGTNYRTILNAEEVLATLGRDKVSSIAELTTEDIIRLDSASLTVEHWLTLARRTEEVLKSCDAVIITHGTDTMEETAFFLNLCVNSSKPVILTGAMRPASATGFEGALNLYNSITAAASGKLEDCGVVICMNGTLIASRDARKIHPTRPDAFTPVEMGSIGCVTDGCTELYYRPVRRHTVHSEFNCRKYDTLPDVRILYACAGTPDDYFDFCKAKHTPGVVIAGVGNGNLSKLWQKRVQELSGEMTFVRCTRANGFVNRNGSQDDDSMNTVCGGNLSAQKARILLMFALAEKLSTGEIQRVFDQY